jgi:CDP-6-deoxy-D-xylo-4-hexulose-3-dehydrase
MISDNTKALMIPNLLGNLPDWKTIKEIADKYGLIIIEDSADTIGSKYKGGTTGNISDLVTTSFYGSHVITCGGFGGILCTNTIEYYERSKLLQGWGRSSSLTHDSEKIDDRFGQTVDEILYDSKFIFSDIGYNFLPSELSAAFGLAQLKKLEEFIKKRINNFENLHNYFIKYKEWFILPSQNQDVMTAWLAFPLTVRSGAPFDRLDLQIYFEKNNIQTRPIFSGNILRQPGFNNVQHKKSPRGYLNSDKVMAGGILLGCHQGMNNDQLDYVCDIFNDFVKEKL